MEKTFANKEKRMPENYYGVNVKFIPVDRKEVQDPCQLCRFSCNSISECLDIPCTATDRPEASDGYFEEVT